VELDIHATRDGVLIVHHDPDLAELGPIAELDAATARRAKLPNGEPVPTLEEALRESNGLRVWVEIKGLPQPRDHRLFEVLDAGPTPEKYAIHSFDHRIVRRLHGLRSALPCGVLSASYVLDAPALLTATGAATLWQEAHLIDRELVDTVHRAGCTVIAWTVNQDSEAERLARIGVDGLCGNYPDRLRRAAERSRQ
jgi:glycerophosphoryl diester phosphodiesterase